DRRVADHALSSELRLMLEVARERRAGALADLPVDLPAVEAEQLEPLLHLSRLLLAQGLQLHVGSAVFQRGLRARRGRTRARVRDGRRVAAADGLALVHLDAQRASRR